VPKCLANSGFLASEVPRRNVNKELLPRTTPTAYHAP
jgi:hypothetical protein